MSAVDYAITFGYKAQDFYYYGPNGVVGLYHRGNDRPTPTGTPIIIGGQTIGLTGATGLVSGPHLHTQACTANSNYADDFDPGPFEFKYGTVAKAGWHNQFGNHIVMRVGNVDITYAHLSQVNVSVGQFIGVTLDSNQRILENRTGVNQRAEPRTTSAIIKDWPYDLEPFTFRGYVTGESVEGNNIWFVGAYSGGYFWSGAFVDKSTNGLTNLTAQPAPPTPPAPTTFPKELMCVTEVIPADPSNYQTDNFPAKPVGIVLHDFGTDGKDTLAGSLAHFQNKDTTAPHLTISGKRIIQNGKLSWRMYHAGPKGNDKFGIEIDPDVDTNPDTKASVELAVKQLEAYVGYPLERHLHSEYMATSCGDDISKAGLLTPPTPDPVPQPSPELELRVQSLEKKLNDMKGVL